VKGKSPHEMQNPPRRGALAVSLPHKSDTTHKQF